ncbi:hypothetical protein FIV36_06385 [Pseudomonas extremaustralis]|uniref:Uncharacterized protein n=1 Tax=Pseudomonas extremaustralis TaxID=359110 RepID=A0A5C5QL64_9PSED|nr:hypothetical protein FIV36_06385 [Pseudomonas extremaustralis]
MSTRQACTLRSRRSAKCCKKCVGASWLAKVFNDNAGRLVHNGALRFFASKLASTGSLPTGSES